MVDDGIGVAADFKCFVERQRGAEKRPTHVAGREGIVDLASQPEKVP